MNGFDALILPSNYEELGCVGLEAYSIGLPVIASDVPSFRVIFKIASSSIPTILCSLLNY